MRLAKLNNIFLYKFLYLFTFIYITIGIILFFIIEEIYIKQNKISLEDSVDIILMNTSNIKELKNKFSFNKNLNGIYVSVINSTGDIISSNKENIYNVQNQKEKKEIILSRYQNYGFSVRYSSYLDSDFIYIAKKFLLKEKIYFLQVSRSINFIDDYFYSLFLKFLLIFFIFISIFFYMSWRISKRLSLEIKYILNFLRLLSKETKSFKITSTYSKEFHKITKLLSILSKKLFKKNKKKIKYENKLKLLNKEKDTNILKILNLFNQPILIIIGYIDSIKNDKDIEENTKISFLNKIESNANVITTMLSRLKLAINLDSKNNTYIYSRFDIVKLINHVNIDLLKTYPKYNVIFKNEMKELNLDINLTIFKTAIINLIENAIKFSDSSITIKLEEKSLTIIDSGIGIAQDNIKRVTEKFYKISSDNDSLGVGLFLVQKILELHTFNLEIESKEGEGSSFKIKFKD